MTVVITVATAVGWALALVFFYVGMVIVWDALTLPDDDDDPT